MLFHLPAIFFSAGATGKTSTNCSFCFFFLGIAKSLKVEVLVLRGRETANLNEASLTQLALGLCENCQTLRFPLWYLCCVSAEPPPCCKEQFSVFGSVKSARNGFEIRLGAQNVFLVPVT